MVNPPAFKTKIVCTIGPASDSPEMLERMILAGMNVARINFSHGDFAGHGKVIENLRKAGKKTGRPVAIMADLPGPKLRIGTIEEEPVNLDEGGTFVLTASDVRGTRERVSVTSPRLPEVAKAGDMIFLNDGLIHLEVVHVDSGDVRCRVVVGGELRSRKGLNLPGIDLGMSAFTEQDRECLKFALEMGVDAVSQSFVEKEDDILALRDAAEALGGKPFLIAKVERAGALRNLEGILRVADGIMIARGDLGVEIPIEEIALVQKGIMEKAVMAGRPVITATQMLESMVYHRRPTRAEATDVANAILDGTDCVMLSAESALGKYPVDAVEMLSKIAEITEPGRPANRLEAALKASDPEGDADPVNIISLGVHLAQDMARPAAVIVPTVSGYTARSISRFRLPVWITAVTPHDSTSKALQFSYGVYPVHEPDYPEDWNYFAREYVRSLKLPGNIVILTEGPSKINPGANNRMEIIDLSREPGEKNKGGF